MLFVSDRLFNPFGKPRVTESSHETEVVVDEKSVVEEPTEPEPNMAEDEVIDEGLQADEKDDEILGERWTRSVHFLGNFQMKCLRPPSLRKKEKVSMLERIRSRRNSDNTNSGKQVIIDVAGIVGPYIISLLERERREKEIEEREKEIKNQKIRSAKAR